MKKLSMLMLIGIMFLVGCQSSDQTASYINIEATEKFLNQEKEESHYPDIEDEDIFDFSYIKVAPEAEKDHKVDDIIKMYATTWSIDELNDPIVIDIENSEIYAEPSVDHLGVQFETERKKVDDIDDVVALFDTYDVLDWQHYYSNVKDHHSYEDGASWSLVVQYSDGTVDKFRGEGTSFKEIIPDNYYDFMDALGVYVVDHIG